MLSMGGRGAAGGSSSGVGRALDLGDLREEEKGRLLGVRLLGCYDNQGQGSLSHPFLGSQAGVGVVFVE